MNLREGKVFNHEEGIKVVKRNDSVGMLGILSLVLFLGGCTVKAVGDPNRPITINAHITLDIKGLKDSASNIEDFVSGEKSKEDFKKSNQSGGKG